MRNIYLASDSKARRKLFQVFGLKFKVVSSGINEIQGVPGNNYAALAMNNALQKAEAVGGRVKGGIIIGADTIVVQGNEVFGKPKDLTQARNMLKKLSGKAQWIYTGLAVIDKDKGKKKVGCEKTRIYMDKLTDREIMDYFSSVTPMDKAGSFDIQGKGAFFIKRIEGCFYNVVGLPLNLLYRMFKGLKIKVFLFLLLAFNFLLIAGCSTEYNLVTGEEETYFYSTDREVQLGRALVKEVEKQYKPADDPLIQVRLETIGKKIAAVCDRKDVDYSFKALQEDEVNAVSLPGGFIYVNSGLVEKVSNDDELAGVLAHEIGHVVARHSIKKLQSLMSYNVLRLLTMAVPAGGAVGATADVAFTEIFLGYAREDELLADQLAARYMKLAGYDPRGMITFLVKLQEIHRKKPAAPKSYFRTHPYVADRIRIVKQEMGEKIDFTDYINIGDKKHE